MKFYLWFLIPFIFSGCGANLGINSPFNHKGKLYSSNGEQFDGYTLVTDMKIADKNEDLTKALILFSGVHENFEMYFDLYWAKTCKTEIDSDYNGIVARNIDYDEMERFSYLKKTNQLKYYENINMIHKAKCGLSNK